MSFLANKVLDNGTLVTNKVDSVNFSSNLSVTDDGNGAITVTGSTNPDQNLFETITADTGSTTANTTTDTLNIIGGTGISTSLSGDTLTIVNDSPNVDQNIWLTISGDSGSTSANTTTDTLTIAGGTNVTTSISGDTLTIDVSATGQPDQNLWETFSADTGSTSANTTTDSFVFTGGAGIITSISGDTLTITNDAPNVPLVIAEDGTTIQTNTTTVNFTGNVDVTDDGGGQVTVNVQNTIGNNLGSMFIVPFGSDGPVRDSWLDLYFNNLISNNVWAVLPWDCNLVGVTFSNSQTNSSFIINVYQLAVGATPGTGETVAYTWSVSNARTGSSTDLGTFPAFSAGDGVAIFITDNGGDPRDLVCTLYFQVNTDVNQTITQNRSGTMTI